jgi:cytochrome c oxidase subunit 4
MEDNNNHPNYVLVWVALAVLTAVEVGITYLSWSKTTLIVVLIGLAVWKAVLVAMYFMHLKYEKRPLRILAVAPIPLAFILVLVVITEFRW